MAYVRKRTTKSGSVSTALIEAYRDESGRPRQRVLANLHGEPDTLRALAKLMLKRDALLAEREAACPEPSNEGAGFVLVTERAITKYNRRLAQIDRELAIIEREGAVIMEHCTASDDRFQEAMQHYREEYCALFERAVGATLYTKAAHAALRRKSE
jgi:hypothetical protein